MSAQEKNRSKNINNQIINEEKLSTSPIKLFQCFENMINGYGFRSSQKIKDYNNSEIGKFLKSGIEELKTTEWAKSTTGQHVIKGLEDAYKKGKIHEQEGAGGLQLGWGVFANVYIGKDAIDDYLNEEKKSALAILAHEGSHYTYATRYGIFSGWWLQYEVEAYRISDILNIEFAGKNWIGGDSVRTAEEIESYLKRNPSYKWIPKFPFGFNYWNEKDIGQ